MMGRVGSLVGRVEEQAVLLEALSSATDGSGRMVLISGEAGAGKSALLRHFTDQVARAAEVLTGWCDPLSTPRPGGPLADMAGRLGPDVSALLDSGRRDGLFDAVLAAATSAAQLRVLVLEDLHWADELTLDLMTFLARRVDTTRLLVLATLRDDEVADERASQRWIGEIGRLPGVVRLGVGPLSLAEISELADGTAFDPAELHARTGGNAFFATEVLAAGDLEVPAKISDAVLARTAALSVEARHALTSAAVLGARSEASVLLELAEVTAVAIDECVSAGLLRFNPPSFEFRHELARQVVVASTPPAARVALHEQALRLLARQVSADILPVLAEHAEHAADADAVLMYAAAAAVRAAGLGAHREAAQQYRRALRFATKATPEQRAGLQAALSFELYLTGALDEAIIARQASLDHHESTGDVAGSGEDLRSLSRLSWYAGRTADAERFAARAVETLGSLGPSPALAMAWSTLSQVAMVQSDYRTAVDLGNRALAMASEVGDEETRIHALNNIGTSLTSQGDLTGIAMVEESLDLARAAQLDDHSARAYVNLVFTAARERDYVLLDRHLDAAIAHCESHEVEVQRLYLEASRLLSDVHRGRWDHVEREATLLLKQSGVSRVHRFVASVPLVLVRLRTGVASDLQVRELRALAGELDESQRRDPALLVDAERAWLDGCLVDLLDELGAAALAATERGDRVASEIVWWIRRADPSHPSPEATGPYAHALTTSLEDAATHWQDLGCPYEAAITLLDGDESQVRAALSTFDRLGAVPAAAIARRRLMAMGVRGPRATTSSHEFGLTNRERQVLGLLRERRSNAQIAAELVISERTVHHHVSAILAKLGVSNRAEAAQIGQGDEPT